MKPFNVIVKILLVVIVLYSCNTETTNNISNNDVVVNYFDEPVETAKFDGHKDKAKWDQIVGLCKHMYSNNEEIEQWLLDKSQILYSRNIKIEENQLTQLLEQLYSSKFNKLGFLVAEHTLKNAQSQSKTYGIASAILTNHYFNLNIKDSSAKYLYLLEKSVDRNKTDYWLQLTYLSCLAYYKFNDGDFLNALVSYHNAIDFAHKDDNMALGTLYQELTNVYLLLKNYERARYYLEKSMMYINEHQISIYGFNLYGLIHANFEEYRQSEQAFNKMYDLAVQTNNIYSMAQYYSNFGNLRRRQKKFDEATQLMDQSDSICIANGIGYGVLVNAFNRTELYIDQSNFRAALALITSIKEDVYRYNKYDLNAEYYKLMYIIHDALGDTASANSYYRIHIQQNEKYLGNLPRAIIAEWELNREHKNHEITEAKYQLELQKESKNKFIIMFLMSLLLLIGSVVFIIIILIQSKKRKQLALANQRLASDLDIKTKQLFSDSLKNIGTQQTKQWLLEELNAIITDLPNEHKKLFNSVIRKLKKDDNPTFSEDFETKMVEVNDKFYKDLEQRFPDLTPNERRLCAFLRLDFVSKDIVAITGQSLRAVEIARSRLRKKLGITNSNQSITDFLKQI
jgi:hypothetical protein